MNKKYIITIDQGTTSTRAILFDMDGRMIATSKKDVNNYFPFEGAVTQNALEILLSVTDSISELMVKMNLKPEQILSLGITNQRETTILFDKDGMPLYDAIVWQSKQSQEICEALNDKKDFIKQKTGLILNPYFSASKIRYILDHIENGQIRAEKGEILFGTVDTFLLYRLTKGKSFKTDYTNASRTLLYNIFEKKWDEDLLKLFNIPRIMLPEVCDSSSIFGVSDILSPNYELKIAGILGDQQASLFGQTCFNSGDIKTTYGTGCFILMNIGENPKLLNNGLLTTIAYGIDHKITYAVEGSVLIGGASIQWLRDKMCLLKDAKDSEESCYKTCDELYVVPAFVGLGSPYWDNNCRGAIFGLTRNSTKDALIKATVEAIAYQVKDIMEVIKKETKQKFTFLSVDGGASNNNYLIQFQSDILNIKIKKGEIFETTSLGVFYLCLLTLGIVSSLDDLKKMHKINKTFKPKMENNLRKAKYKKWKIAIKATRTFI